MEEASSRATFESLSEIMRSSGMGWLTAQVDETIAAGITDEVTGDELSSIEVGALDFRPRSRKATALRTRPYSAEEELNLLIDATTKAIEDARAILVQLSRYLQSINSVNPGFAARIDFVSDEGLRRDALSLGSDVLGDRDSGFKVVLDSLRALR